MNRLLQNLLNHLPDRLFIDLQYFHSLHRFPNWRNPKYYTEKLQWIKLYDRNPKYSIMVDKFAVKDFVKETLGEKYIIPTIGVWNSVEEIPWNQLPAQFVLKTTHGGGGNGVVICRDISSFDQKEASRRLASNLSHNTYLYGREWPYKNVPHRILAEKYMEDETGELRDYKVMCFSGEPKLIQIHIGRYKGQHTQDFYDIKWNKLSDLNQVGCVCSSFVAPKPLCLDEMLNCSRILSAGIPHVRVDWYVVEGQLFFGELTFFDASGYDPFIPKEKDQEIGSWISLHDKI